MAVKLDQLPPLAPRPGQPRLWLWLAVLPLLLATGVGCALLLDDTAMQQDPVLFWGMALGLLLVGWCALSGVRAALFIAGEHAADGWDDAREADRWRRVSRGRRTQQLLGASLHTALRHPVPNGAAAQIDALLKGARALKTQPCWQSGAAVRHSRLMNDDLPDEDRLLEALSRVLADLAPRLALLPDTTPLALLLELDSDLPPGIVQRTWQRAWREAGIRQPLGPVDGSGLAVVDQWLDHRIAEPTLLMVVALHMLPQLPEGTAEVAVGVLCGNRLTQAILAPLAYLHRPEQARELGLGYAARQALDWVPLQASGLEHTWRVAIPAQREVQTNEVINELGLPNQSQKRVCDLDALLGLTGRASPWLAIAAATHNIERGAGPQFIFSGKGSVETESWCMVLTPAPPLLT